MRTVRMLVAYDGTEFHGWQRQPGWRTVQGVLEAALGAVLGVEGLTLQGAGRTDAGVHARGQVASFRAELPLPARALAPALAPRLPEDVRVLAAIEAPDDFDARRSAISRCYSYRLLREPDPLFGRFAWRPARWPAEDALQAASGVLVGEHDFSSFRSAGSTPSSPVCRVTRAEWRAWEGGLLLDITADRFLYRMVRSIVGTALAASVGADPAGRMRAILAARDRAAASATAPARALCFERAFYPGESA
ncbi:MAG TPA: tRNA pseudouridine(38-40) synthase TruA [Terriglobales bacterium]|nr:tRNA pseudouridine(38-40) synthase TruA [Terriglobales bacterium]